VLSEWRGQVAFRARFGRETRHSRRVLHFALKLISFAFAFGLAVAGYLSNNFLHFSLGLLSRALDAIFSTTFFAPILATKRLALRAGESGDKYSKHCCAAATEGRPRQRGAPYYSRAARCRSRPKAHSNIVLWANMTEECPAAIEALRANGAAGRQRRVFYGRSGGDGSCARRGWRTRAGGEE
jgi:hypothetical protein